MLHRFFSAKNTLIAVIFTTLIFISLASWHLLSNSQTKPNELSRDSFRNYLVTPTIVADTPATTPQQTPTLTPTPTEVISTTTPSPTAILFPLNISAVDYSWVDPKGVVIGAKVRLYNGSGTLVGSGIVPEVIFSGNVGTGGNVHFDVPLGSYKAEVETDTLTGSDSINLQTLGDWQYYTIRLYCKPIIIRGKYYLDSNKSGTYNEGEEIFTNKKINAYVRSGHPYRQLYSSETTTTDSAGNFTLSVKYAGSYTLSAEYVKGQQLPAHYVDLNCNSSNTLDTYTWPI